MLPWHTACLSGWIIDPDRKKMGKSTNNGQGPVELLDRYGSDAVRYWAAGGRPGVDMTFDEGQLKVGRRLATKILNASRFALGFGPLAGDITEPVDTAMLAQLSTVVDTATRCFTGYDHTGALTATETFFWSFCDDYIELVKDRAYTDGAPAASARAALGLALSVQLRLFAPFLPFVAEEAWSWFQPGSVHRSSWPAPAELDHGGDPAILSTVAEALGQVRRAKSERQLSMRAEVTTATVRASEAELAYLRWAEPDLRAAGRLSDLVFVPTTDARPHRQLHVPAIDLGPAGGL